jgi:hypothetical protein
MSKVNKKLHLLSEEQEEDAEILSSMMKKGKQSLADLKKEAHELFTSGKKMKIYGKVLDMLLEDEEISEKKYEKYNGYLADEEFEKVEKLVNKYPELIEKASVKKARTKPKPKLDSDSDDDDLRIKPKKKGKGLSKELKEYLDQF